MSRYTLLSVAEVAEQLSRKRWFVYKLLDSRRLPYYLIGGGAASPKPILMPTSAGPGSRVWAKRKQRWRWPRHETTS